MVTRVKICGIAREQDAWAAAEAGADALGFVFEPTSPRCVEGWQGLPDLVKALGPYMPAFAVYGRAPSGSLPTGFRHVQAIARPRGFDGVFVQALGLGGDLTVEAVLSQLGDAQALLLDAHKLGQWGGTGETVDWGLAREIVAASPIPVVLAGGLRPENVAQAIEQVRPYAVDVSSGVEAGPGVKDRDRLRAFVRAAKGLY